MGARPEGGRGLSPPPRSLTLGGRGLPQGPPGRCGRGAPLPAAPLPLIPSRRSGSSPGAAGLWRRARPCRCNGRRSHVAAARAWRGPSGRRSSARPRGGSWARPLPRGACPSPRLPSRLGWPGSGSRESFAALRALSLLFSFFFFFSFCY